MVHELCDEIKIIIKKEMFISASYPRVLEVSSIKAGVTAQIMAVCALPPSDDCSILVSLLSRKFTY